MIELTLFLIVLLGFFSAAVYYDQLPEGWNRRLDNLARWWLNRHEKVVLNRRTYENTVNQLKNARARLKKLGGGSRSKVSEPHKQARRVTERQIRSMEDSAGDQLT